jgi:hypothetical protein
MRRIIFLLGGIAIALFHLHAAPAQAQARVFVAAQGSDSNPCTFALPCRTFQHAHDIVVAGGEIDVLDPAGYGSLTITKALSVQGHGYSGITGIITINAGPSDNVNLRGLLIEGSVLFTTGASLNIQESVIRNSGPTHGINFAATGASKLIMSQTLISDIGSGFNAINIGPTGGGSAIVVLDHVALDNASTGLTIFGNNTVGSIKVTIADSAVSNMGSSGISASSDTGPTQVMVRNCTIFNAGVAIAVNQIAAVVRLTKSTITGNLNGLGAGTGGQLISYGDNNVDGNTTDFVGAPTSTIPYH